MTIMSWNLSAWETSKEEYFWYNCEYNVDIVCLQETRQKLKSNKSTTFTCWNRGPDLAAGGGVAIGTRNSSILA